MPEDRLKDIIDNTERTWNAFCHKEKFDKEGYLTILVQALAWTPLFTHYHYPHLRDEAPKNTFIITNSETVIPSNMDFIRSVRNKQPSPAEIHIKRSLLIFNYYYPHKLRSYINQTFDLVIALHAMFYASVATTAFLASEIRNDVSLTLVFLAELATQLSFLSYPQNAEDRETAFNDIIDAAELTPEQMAAFIAFRTNYRIAGVDRTVH